MQCQSIFLIQQQQSEPITDSHVGTGGKVTHAQAAKTDIGRFAESDGLFQTFIFNSQRQSGPDIVTGKLASLMIG